MNDGGERVFILARLPDDVADGRAVIIFDPSSQGIGQQFSASVPTKI